MNFFKSIIRDLMADGHSVDIITNEKESNVSDCFRQWGCAVYGMDTSRSPLNKGNLKAIKQIRKLVEKEKYEVVHCHTPIAAMCTRLACRKARKKGTQVIYTAHGFHFYKGAPKKNWLLFYPIEKLCAKYTDLLITINKEDYAFAKRKLKAKKIDYVPGVGIDLEKFGQHTIDVTEKRKELGVPSSAKLLLSVGELNENKNHKTVIKAIADMDVYYVIAGKGPQKESLELLIEELGLKERVKLLGYRSDVNELCQVADAYVLPSIREGLNVSIMEAMASGLPVVCGNIRGNVDLIDEGLGGSLFSPLSVEDCKQALTKTLGACKKTLGEYNLDKIKKFSLATVNEKMKELYGV